MEWTRQAQSGFRLFDFWNAHLGVAVEIDGPEHDRAKDALDDTWQKAVREIVVIRVNNFDESGARDAVRKIAGLASWNDRRVGRGMKAIGKS